MMMNQNGNQAASSSCCTNCMTFMKKMVRNGDNDHQNRTLTPLQSTSNHNAKLAIPVSSSGNNDNNNKDNGTNDRHEKKSISLLHSIPEDVFMIHVLSFLFYSSVWNSVPFHPQHHIGSSLISGSASAIATASAPLLSLYSSSSIMSSSSFNSQKADTTMQKYTNIGDHAEDQQLIKVLLLIDKNTNKLIRSRLGLMISLAPDLSGKSVMSSIGIMSNPHINNDKYGYEVKSMMSSQNEGVLGNFERENGDNYQKWQKIHGLSLHPVWWSRFSMSYEDVLNRIIGNQNRNAENGNNNNILEVPPNAHERHVGNNIGLNSKLRFLEQESHAIGTKFSRFDISLAHQYGIKVLRIEGKYPKDSVVIESDDLKKIESMQTIETLIMTGCKFLCPMDMFPKGLKHLYIQSSLDVTPHEEMNVVNGNMKLNIHNLPTTLEKISCDENVLIEKQSNIKNLLNLRSLQIICSRATGISSILTMENIPQTVTELKLQRVILENEISYLPPSLLRLDISECTGLTELNYLPINLKYLSVESCNNLKSIEIPDNLERFRCVKNNFLLHLYLRSAQRTLQSIEIRECYLLQKIPFSYFPLSLHELKIGSIESLPNIKLVYPMLRLLSVSDVGEVEFLKDLSRGHSIDDMEFSGLNTLEILPDISCVRNLKISTCMQLHDTFNIPYFMKELCVENASLSKMHSFPISLRYLVIRNCPNIETIQDLPPNLQVLELTNLTRLARLGSIPNIRYFQMKWCNLLAFDCSRLPASIQTLVLVENNLLSEDIQQLPDDLSTFVLKDIQSRIKSLPGTFPRYLKSLLIENCMGLRMLPSLPGTLQELGIVNCKDLNTTGEENDMAKKTNLRVLRLSECPEIFNSLQSFPESLQSLHVTGVGNRYIPAIPRNVKFLSII